MRRRLRGIIVDVSIRRSPRLPLSERLRRVGISAWAIIGILILAAALVWALLKVSVILPPLLLALVIIYLLNPVVTKLHSWGVPRSLGAIGSYLVFFLLLVLLVLLVIPLVGRQVSSFSKQWPQFRAELLQTVDSFAISIEDRFNVDINTAPVDCVLGAEGKGASSPRECDAFTQELRDRVAGGAGRILSLGVSVLGALLLFVVAPILALYLLIDLPNLQKDALRLVPGHLRDEAADLGSKIGQALGGYFRGQLVVATIVGLLSALGFWIIGLPFFLIIGAVAGFFNLVPLIGPYIGGGIGFVIGSISGGLGLGLKAALVELIVQQIDNHVISPGVMKRAVSLHPTTVMLSLLAAGTVAGFWGMLLAVPTVATIKLCLAHLWTTRVLGEEIGPHSPAGAEKPEGPESEEVRVSVASTPKAEGNSPVS
ncbi:N/A [soil metagenome]